MWLFDDGGWKGMRGCRQASCHSTNDILSESQNIFKLQIKREAVLQLTLIPKIMLTRITLYFLVKSPICRHIINTLQLNRAT